MGCDHPDFSEGDFTHPSEIDLANIVIVECRDCGNWFHLFKGNYDDEILLLKIEENRREMIKESLRRGRKYQNWSEENLS